jgi:hypothetical protein
MLLKIVDWPGYTATKKAEKQRVDNTGAEVARLRDSGKQIRATCMHHTIRVKGVDRQSARLQYISIAY